MNKNRVLSRQRISEHAFSRSKFVYVNVAAFLQDLETGCGQNPRPKIAPIHVYFMRGIGIHESLGNKTNLVSKSTL